MSFSREVYRETQIILSLIILSHLLSKLIWLIVSGDLERIMLFSWRALSCTGKEIFLETNQSTLQLCETGNCAAPFGFGMECQLSWLLSRILYHITLKPITLVFGFRWTFHLFEFFYNEQTWVILRGGIRKMVRTRWYHNFRGFGDFSFNTRQ